MTIICVDSSPISLVRLWMQTKQILPDAEVKCCRTSKEALDAANRIKAGRTQKEKSQNAKCDILITDVDLGAAKGEGLQLAEEVKKLYPHVNIIFVAGGAEWDYSGQILKMRPSGCLSKPFSREELKDELCNLRYMPNTEDLGVLL